MDCQRKCKDGMWVGLNTTKDADIFSKLNSSSEKTEDIKKLNEKLIDLLREDVIMDLKSKKLI